MAYRFMTLMGVWKGFREALEEEIVAASGSIEMLEGLAKKQLRPAIKELARWVVNFWVFKLLGNFGSHTEAIKAGKYDCLVGYAENPTEIKGAPIHSVDCDTRLEHIGNQLTIGQIWDRFTFSMADLAELEVFGINYPEVQRQFPIVTIWKDLDDQFWYAKLGASDQGRFLCVNQVLRGVQWSSYSRFLVHKPRA